MSESLHALLLRSVALASVGKLPQQALLREMTHKVCPCCGRRYSREQWEQLPCVGVQRFDDCALELRNCSACFSTISVEVP